MRLESDQKSERIDVRTTPHVKRFLQEAASTANKTVTEFLLDSALTEAAEILADRRTLFLNETQWKEFMAALDYAKNGEIVAGAKHPGAAEQTPWPVTGTCPARPVPPRAG